MQRILEPQPQAWRHCHTHISRDVQAASHPIAVPNSPCFGAVDLYHAQLGSSGEQFLRFARGTISPAQSPGLMF